MIMVILLVPVWEQFDAATNPVYVDFTHTGSEDGTFDNPYSKLADALNAVSGGETILIRAGTTNETLTINKNVTIQSSGGTANIGQ